MDPIPEGKKRLLLVMNDGTQKRITVDKGLKVTFGAMIPGQKESAGKTALRLWSGSKGNEIQHAVFTDVVSFRDMSIEVMEQVEKVQQETFVRQGSEDGEAIQAEVRVKEWVNPDEPKAKSVPEIRPAAPGALIRAIRS